MSIAVTCPSGHQLLVADNMAGKSGRCPFCREIVHVPGAANLPPPLPCTAPPIATASASTTPPVAAATTGPKLLPSGAAASATPTVVPFGKRAASEPAVADTVLMPLSLEELSSGAAALPLDEKLLAEPDSPVPAEPDLMSQTLPLPTAELMPKKSTCTSFAIQDVHFDTVAQKGRIVGAWKILGDSVPPYVPESINGRNGSASELPDEPPADSPVARAFADAELAIAAPPEGVPHAETSVQSASRAHATVVPAGGPNESEAVSDGSTNSFAPPISSDGAWRRQSGSAAPLWPIYSTAYRISAAVAILSLLSIWPAARYWDLGAAPVWARGALLAAVLELAYSVWLISIPHSTSLWASMFVLTIVATMYGAAAALVLASPLEHDLPLGLNSSMRGSAPIWCFEIMLATLSLAYICGHASLRTDSSRVPLK